MNPLASAGVRSGKGFRDWAMPVASSSVRLGILIVEGDGLGATTSVHHLRRVRAGVRPPERCMLACVQRARVESPSVRLPCRKSTIRASRAMWSSFQMRGRSGDAAFGQDGGGFGEDKTCASTERLPR